VRIGRMNFFQLIYFHAPLLILLILILLGYLTAMLIVVTIKKDRSIANFTWGGGVLIIAIYNFIISFVQGHPPSGREILITTLTVLWGIRLLSYIYLRYRGDDPRYQSWKQSGIKAFFLNVIWIFVLNVAAMLVMITPVQIVGAGPDRPLTYLDFIGLAVWVIGFYFESVSDYQLFKFTQDPANKGRVMQSGLWRYSRHPNYFGEVLMWWGIFLIAFNVPYYGIYAIIAPITITFLLLFVTGIPWVEQAMAHNPEYQEYKKHTSIFIPWFSE
jgi:steroid 5-alpha reductase family enzyme